MPFPVKAVANEFLKLAREDGEALTAMKLQKLVYYAHGLMLAVTGKPLIPDRIEAWEWGPVIPELYREFKRFGNDPITEQAADWTMRDLKIFRAGKTIDDFEESPARDDAQQVIKSTWTRYGRFTASKLSNATHAPGTPWHQVYRPGERGIVIPNPLIQRYFEGLLTHGR